MQSNAPETDNQQSQSITAEHALEVDGITPPTIPGGPLKWLLENPLPAHMQRSAAEIDASIEAERNSWD